MTSPPSFSISDSIQPHLLALQLLHANSKAYPHNYTTSTVQLAPDQCHTCPDLVPMPSGTVYIPLCNLSDLSSLVIMWNSLSFFLIHPFLLSHSPAPCSPPATPPTPIRPL